MNQNISGISSNFNKAVNPQQFDQIVEAILAGKYSWACVLMLRIVGYNPLHYIPYRTYNRLLKDNTQVNRTQQQHSQNMKAAQPSMNHRSNNNTSTSCLNKIKDFAYLEVAGKPTNEIRGSSVDN
ncbi:HetP family heterocyst commitment protein [Nodularia sp. UHCC 0506]|uniref:HetP family heterocyst commitment protein n=1 Tax=Nodularia sp. UHCC 0506 TaxID=3110243 RepID=UPI002B1FD9CA|nr:HetP family heterocyst commitment protein [Nodularia sp. UHCC 0506]MEA5516038.1 HetP family heterocyst commitment protein [Nodularia sp. UHCC 0506]